MAFKDWIEAAENRGNFVDTEAPVMGKAPIVETNIVPAKNLTQKVHYYVANMNDPSDREFVSDIMTKGLQNSLTNKIVAGTIDVIKEETTWSKEGDYLVAIKYVEFVERT